MSLLPSAGTKGVNPDTWLIYEIIKELIKILQKGKRNNSEGEQPPPPSLWQNGLATPLLILSSLIKLWHSSSSFPGTRNQQAKANKTFEKYSLWLAQGFWIRNRGNLAAFLLWILPIPCTRSWLSSLVALPELTLWPQEAAVVLSDGLWWSWPLLRSYQYQSQNLI